MDSEQSSLIEAVFYHLVLPPKLPRKFDGDEVALTQNLSKRLLEALASLRLMGEPTTWDNLDASLKATGVVNQGSLAGDDLRDCFKSVLKSRITLALHVAQQNAALLIQRDVS